MDLTTRCPSCNTVFKASLQDLQLRKGYIRCVQCAHIFDGYAEVVSEPGEDGPEPRPPAALGARPGPSFFANTRREPTAPDVPPPHVPLSGAHEADRAAARDDEPHIGEPHVFRSARSRPEPEFQVGDSAWERRPPEPRLGALSALGASGRDEPSLAAAARTRPSPEEPSGQADAFIVEADPHRRSRGGSAAPLLYTQETRAGGAGILVSWSLRLLLAVLVLLIIGQLLYVFRNQVAQAVPPVRPWLQQACLSLNCTVSYPRDIAKIVVTGSSLKEADTASGADQTDQSAVSSSSKDGSARSGTAIGAGEDAGTPQKFVLELNLRNRAEYPLAWPTVVLDLKDSAGTRLIRRNLSPDDYLGRSAARHPFPADSEVLIRVPVEVSGVRINGYQLDLFYP